MISFGPSHFFKSGPAHKTFPCGFNGDLGCYVFLKTFMCSQKSFGVPCEFIIMMP